MEKKLVEGFVEQVSYFWLEWNSEGLMEDESKDSEDDELSSERRGERVRDWISKW